MLNLVLEKSRVKTAIVGVSLKVTLKDPKSLLQCLKLYPLFPFSRSKRLSDITLGSSTVTRIDAYLIEQ